MQILSGIGCTYHRPHHYADTGCPVIARLAVLDLQHLRYAGDALSFAQIYCDVDMHGAGQNVNVDLANDAALSNESPALFH